MKGDHYDDIEQVELSVPVYDCTARDVGGDRFAADGHAFVGFVADDDGTRCHVAGHLVDSDGPYGWYGFGVNRCWLH